MVTPFCILLRSVGKHNPISRSDQTLPDKQDIGSGGQFTACCLYTLPHESQTIKKRHVFPCTTHTNTHTGLHTSLCLQQTLKLFIGAYFFCNPKSWIWVWCWWPRRGVDLLTLCICSAHCVNPQCLIPPAVEVHMHLKKHMHCDDNHALSLSVNTLR